MSRRRPFFTALNGGTQTVVPGKLSVYKLKFPAKLKAKLRSMSRKESLKLTVEAATRNEAGQVFTKATTVKLPGQG
jgi:hypothetical protein